MTVGPGDWPLNSTMPTIANVIDRALEKAGIKDPSQDAETEDVSTALDELNDMMHEWHQNGMWLNYTEAEASTDRNTAHRYAHGAMKTFLALRLCSEYQRPVPQTLAAAAVEQKALLSNQNSEFAPTAFPGTFPRGEGNISTDFGRYHYDDFYYEEGQDDLRIAGGTLTDGRGVALEDGSDEFNADRNI